MSGCQSLTFNRLTVHVAEKRATYCQNGTCCFASIAWPAKWDILILWCILSTFFLGYLSTWNTKCNTLTVRCGDESTLSRQDSIMFKEFLKRTASFALVNLVSM